MENPLSFHIQLRYERQVRGWSQADIASKINSDPKTIARWERGKGLPRPYHRQALCKLFAKNAQELGLISGQAAILPTSLAEIDHPPSAVDLDTATSPHEVKRKVHQNIEGFPPPTNPRTIQQREDAVQAIYAWLLQADTTALALTGIGGIGKSTLAALVYQYALARYQAGESPFLAPPLWLTIHESVTMIDLIGTLLEALGAPLPDLERLSPGSQVMTLFHASRIESNTRLIILDQFENVLDWRTGEALPERPGVGEWLDALNSQPSCCKFLLTSRPWPRGIRNYSPTYLHEYPVASLKLAEGVALLRQQGVRATQATDAQLQKAVTQCDGHAFALTLFASLLRCNDSLTVPLICENPLYTPLWNGDIARNILDHIYMHQLDEIQRTLLFTFSVYRKPVPLEASLALTDLKAEDFGTTILAALQGLLTQHLVQTAGEALYQVHMIVAQYVHEYGSDEHQGRILGIAHTRAATYYLKQQRITSLPGYQQRTISDLQPLIEAVWHLCRAALQREAFDLIQRENVFLDLRRLGGNATLIELYLLLFPLKNWNPSPAQEAEICDQLGRIYGTLGRKESALEHYEHALRLYRTMGNRQGEGRALNHIASAQENLGLTTLARELHEQALIIGREIDDRKAEADSLNGLGWIAYRQGEQEEALRHYEQSLHLYREAGNRIGESDALNGIGLVYQILGRKDQAFQLIEQALHLRREVKDRGGEGRTLNHLGLVYAELGKEDQAYECYTASFLIRKETGDRNGEGVVLYNLGKLSFKRGQHVLALACWLEARNIFEEVRSANRDAAQKWIDRLQEAVRPALFHTLLAEAESYLSRRTACTR